MNKLDMAALKKAGFAAAQRSPARLHASITGLQKVGKTRLALTAPKPLGYIGIELSGEEGVIDRFIPEGVDENPDIQVAHVYVPEFTHGDIKSDDKTWMDENMQMASDALDQFYAAFEYSLQNLRTTVIDAGTDVWELIRTAHAGRLEKVPQLAYGAMNNEFEALLNKAAASQHSVIWLHRMKEIWTDYVDENGKRQGRKTGTFEPAGYKNVPSRVQAVIELWKEELEGDDINPNTGRKVRFCATVTDSRHNPDVMGVEFYDDQINFADLAALITNTDRSQWD